MHRVGTDWAQPLDTGLSKLQHGVPQSQTLLLGTQLTSRTCWGVELSENGSCMVVKQPAPWSMIRWPDLTHAEWPDRQVGLVVGEGAAPSLPGSATCREARLG